MQVENLGDRLSIKMERKIEKKLEKQEKAIVKKKYIIDKAIKKQEKDLKKSEKVKREAAIKVIKSKATDHEGFSVRVLHTIQKPLKMLEKPLHDIYSVAKTSVNAIGQMGSSAWEAFKGFIVTNFGVFIELNDETVLIEKEGQEQLEDDINLNFYNNNLQLENYWENLDVY